VSGRLAAQSAFLTEAERLKTVLRASRLNDGTRRENSAEHSWHVMLFACVLAEHAAEPVSVERVMRMLLIHDIVEIDAGDAPIHGDYDAEEMAAKEQAAATRLFGLLPADQGAAFRELWEEFEAAETADARFAKAIDRFQTPLANLVQGGGTWADYDVTYEQLETRVGTRVRAGAPALWEYLRPMLRAHFEAERTDGEGPG
jgi:putative hydrolase of HD superfamily